MTVGAPETMPAVPVSRDATPEARASKPYEERYGDRPWPGRSGATQRPDQRSSSTGAHPRHTSPVAPRPCRRISWSSSVTAGIVHQWTVGDEYMALEVGPAVLLRIDLA